MCLAELPFCDDSVLTSLNVPVHRLDWHFLCVTCALVDQPLPFVDKLSSPSSLCPFVGFAPPCVSARLVL